MNISVFNNADCFLGADLGTENQEVEHVYRTWSEHCSVILRETSKVKSNWLFILNGGAITAILAIERIFSYEYIQWPIVVYFIGITTNFLSLEVEYFKFRKMGKYLENLLSIYNKHQDYKSFMNKAFNMKWTQWPQYLERISFACFVVASLIFGYLIYLVK